jgi:hypothetical protein
VKLWIGTAREQTSDVLENILWVAERLQRDIAPENAIRAQRYFSM